MELGKIRGKYIILEVLIHLEYTEILRFLHMLSKKGRQYMVHNLRYIKFRGPKETYYNENRQKVFLSEYYSSDLVCVYLNYERKRKMVYDIKAESMLFLVNFMQKVLEKDPTCSLIKIC